MWIDRAIPEDIDKDDKIRGYWKVIAMVILQAIQDACRGRIGAHVWIMKDRQLDEYCEILGLSSINVRQAYTKLRESKYVKSDRYWKSDFRMERHKEVQRRGAVDGDLYMMKNGIVEVPYSRIIIKNKKL